MRRNLRGLVLGIARDEAGFLRRGFRIGAPDVQLALERIGCEFISGYMVALGSRDTSTLADRLNRVGANHRGFAFEGAAMALMLEDRLMPLSRKRFAEFLDGPGQPHSYMVHVGAGWACARLPWLRWRLDSFLRQFDPLLKWLVVDGYGFHEGYFHPRRSFEEHRVPSTLKGYAARAFDQGLGRSLWFYCCADASAVAEMISKFDEDRRADLWSGVGLACAYAGGTDDREVSLLLRHSASHYPAFAQGVAFAAEARQRAQIPAMHTENVCRTVCESDAATAAAVARQERHSLPDDGLEPAYEIWRQRVQKRLTQQVSHVH